MKRNQSWPARRAVCPVAAAVAAMLGSSYGANALAQGVIEEIIVTASRRANSVQDVPINITAIGRNAIRDQRMVGLEEISRAVPGLHIVDRGSRAVGNSCEEEQEC